MPTAEEPVQFASHIKPLFRAKDLQRLSAGTMPCDGAWPTKQIEVFERWVLSGKLP